MLVDGQALVKLQELQRDADANKNIYEQFLSRFKTTNEQRQLQSSQTKIASLAIPPMRSTRPPLALLLAALAIGSILTSTAAVAAMGSRSDGSAPAEAPAQTPAQTLARAEAAETQVQRPGPAPRQPEAMPNRPSGPAFPIWRPAPSPTPCGKGRSLPRPSSTSARICVRFSSGSIARR